MYGTGPPHVLVLSVSCKLDSNSCFPFPWFLFPHPVLAHKKTYFTFLFLVYTPFLLGNGGCLLFFFILNSFFFPLTVFLLTVLWFCFFRNTADFNFVSYVPWESLDYWFFFFPPHPKPVTRSFFPLLSSPFFPPWYWSFPNSQGSTTKIVFEFQPPSPLPNFVRVPGSLFVFFFRCYSVRLLLV